MADEEKDLKLTEAPDGSVIVEGEGQPQEQHEGEPEGGDASAEGAEDQRLSGVQEDDEGHEDEQGRPGETAEEAAIRKERNRRRRAENRQRRRDYIDGLQRDIAARDELLAQAMQRLDAVERRTTGADMAALDQELGKAGDAYNYFRERHAEAVTKADGLGATEAQEKMYQAARRIEQLNGIKQAYNRQQAKPPQQPLDPRIKANAEAWLQRNAWYDPAGGDMDSRVLLGLDRELHRDGWDPTTDRYWEELDSRAKKYLPHRYNSGHNSGTESRQSRSPVAGSGREAPSRGTGYTLSKERIQALKDAGMWDDPVARNDMIRRYMEQDRLAAEQRG